MREVACVWCACVWCDVCGLWCACVWCLVVCGVMCVVCGVHVCVV